jgi:uncharacterized protein
MRIAITGAGGLIGGALKAALVQSGHELISLVRRPSPSDENEVRWDALEGPPPLEPLEDLDAVVHLAGAPIGPWPMTPRRKKAVVESRVTGTRNLVDALCRCRRPAPVLISASGVGYYGDRQDEVLDEESGPGTGFFPELGQLWEKQALAARDCGTRVVLLRTSPVLSRQGGLLKTMERPFRWFLGGPLGSGRQWMPWIHIEDHIGAIRHLLQQPGLEGPVNAAAPGIVTNKEFSKLLGQVLGRPALLRVPYLALRAVLGELANEIAASKRVIPKRLIESGYRFRYPDLPAALRALFA